MPQPLLPATSPQQYSCHLALIFYIALPHLILKLHCSSVIYTEMWQCVRCVKQNRSMKNGHTWVTSKSSSLSLAVTLCLVPGIVLCPAAVSLPMCFQSTIQ